MLEEAESRVGSYEADGYKTSHPRRVSAPAPERDVIPVYSSTQSRYIPFCNNHCNSKHKIRFVQSTQHQFQHNLGIVPSSMFPASTRFCDQLAWVMIMSRRDLCLTLILGRNSKLQLEWSHRHSISATQLQSDPVSLFKTRNNQPDELNFFSNSLFNSAIETTNHLQLNSVSSTSIHQFIIATSIFIDKALTRFNLSSPSLELSTSLCLNPDPIETWHQLFPARPASPLLNVSSCSIRYCSTYQQSKTSSLQLKGLHHRHSSTPPRY